MVNSSEVWEACPSVSFFFARLGAALGVSGDFFTLIGDYLFEDSGLSVVLGELSPILGRSLAWFERETKRMSEVRSSELDTLLDPRTLSFYCLGPDPSPYVLRSITIEEKKSKCFLRQYCPLPAHFGFLSKFFFFFFF